MNAALALLARDLRLAWRQAGDWLTPLGFFLLAVTLFPLAVTPEPGRLALLAPGVIWVAALLAMLLSLDGLFRQDLEDGALEQLLVAPAPLPPVHDEPPADAAQMEQFYRHLAQTLDEIEFHKGREPTTIMLRLRKLFQRAQPDERELRVLHGILADAQRMAGLAKNGK